MAKILHIWNVLQKLPDKQDVSQIPFVENIIQYHQKAIDILKRQEKTKDKKIQVMSSSRSVAV